MPSLIASLNEIVDLRLVMHIERMKIKIFF